MADENSMNNGLDKEFESQEQKSLSDYSDEELHSLLAHMDCGDVRDEIQRRVTRTHYDM